MGQAVWTGSIAFGLVNVPVKLYIAVSPKDVRFHQFQRGTSRRIRYARVADEAPDWVPAPPRDEPAGEAGPTPTPTGSQPAPQMDLPEDRPDRPLTPEPRPREVVPYTEIVKGYEVAPGRFVTLAPEELEALAPRRTGTIEIEEFVDLADIDPVYFEKPYYVAPAEPAAVKPYSLLRGAMADRGKVAIGRFVMRTKEYLAAIRPRDDVLALHTLYFGDEVRNAGEVPFAGMAAQVSERELRIATQLIEVMATEWEPDRYRDTYREQVLGLIESKAVGETIEVPEEPAPPKVADLMEALRASVEAVKKQKRSRAAGR